MIRIPLTKGFEAFVDDADAPLVAGLRWYAKVSATGTVYAHGSRMRDGTVTRFRMHRLILGASGSVIVDHRDGDGLNNRRENLRLCTRRENNRNRTLYARKKRSAGGFLGVQLHAPTGRWRAAINAGEANACGEARRICLRSYVSAEEAARVYDAAAVHYFGEFAALNFPGEPLVAFDPLDFGRRRHGELEPHAKLNDQAVRLIRTSEETCKALAERLGVSAVLVSKVKRGEIWRHVSLDPTRALSTTTGASST